LRIYRRISKKKYLHGKKVYEYERFYVPVPKRFQQIVKPFVSQDIKVKVEPETEGFIVKVQVFSRPQRPSGVSQKPKLE
jgi:hypothetical protein